MKFDVFLDEWLNLLNECLSYEVPSVRQAAIDALPAFFTEYYMDSKQEDNQNAVIRNYISQLKEPSKIVRMGHVLAIGIVEFYLYVNFFLYNCFSLIGLNPQIYTWNYFCT